MSKLANRKGLPTSPTATARAKTASSEILDGHISELAKCLGGLREQSGDDSSVVHAMLNAAVKHVDPTALRSTTVAWLKRKKSEEDEEDKKFSDGLANAKAANKPQQIVKEHFYPAGYKPPFGADGLVANAGSWQTPTGEIWNSDCIADLGANASVVEKHHSGGQSRDVVLPLWLYSASQIGHHVVWAFWLVPMDNPAKRKWCLLPFDSIDASLAESGESVRVSASWFDSYNLPSGHVPRTAQRVLSGDPHPAATRGSDTTCSMQLFHAESQGCKVPTHHHFYMLRYESLLRGNPKWSPLCDTVAWVPSPVASPSDATPAGFSQDVGELPPCGVLEYLHSRAGDEAVSWPSAQHGWEALPLFGVCVQQLVSVCFAEPDQQAYNAALHNMVRAFLNVLTGVSDAGDITEALEWLREAVQKQGGAALPLEDMRKEMQGLKGCLHPGIEAEKLGDFYASPPPGVLAHLLEMQRLEWGGRSYTLGLSGSRPVISSGGRTFRLFRVNFTYDDQIFYHLNYAMRSQQFGTKTRLSISEGTMQGLYFPEEGDTPQPGEPVQFVRSAGPHATAVWDGFGWKVSVEAERTVVVSSPSAVYLTLGPWLLPQAMPFIFYLDRALEQLGTLPQSRAPPGLQTYRGLKGVTLPTSVYDLGKIVLWSAYSSTSSDRGIASAFAKGGSNVKAAVFSLQGKTCVCISPWSRFAREREWLYPPNSTFQVTSTLDQEQANILGLDNLQLFSMQEVSELEGLAIYLKSLVNQVVATVQGSDMPKYVEQVFRLMRHLHEGDLTAALKLCCCLGLPMIHSTEGHEVASMLVKIGANPTAFTEVALEDPTSMPAPSELLLLVKGGAEFSGPTGAVGWVSTFESQARLQLEGTATTLQGEMLGRAEIERQVLEEGTEIDNALRLSTDIVFNIISTVRVTGCKGRQQHLNGVYSLDPPRVLTGKGMVPVQDMDETRSWGCFVQRVRITKEATTWGLKPGMRLLSISRGGTTYPLQGLDTYNEAIAALEAGSSTEALKVEVLEKLSYTQCNPPRFLADARIFLDTTGEWRLQDAELLSLEAEKAEGWDSWMPVGRWEGAQYDRTATPFRRLVGRWRQKPEYQYSYVIDPPVRYAPSLWGGTTEQGLCVNDGVVADMSQELPPGGGVLRAEFVDGSLIEAVRKQMAVEGEATCTLPVHRLFQHSRLLPVGEYVLHLTGDVLSLVDHRRHLRYALLREERRPSVPIVEAVPPVPTTYEDISKTWDHDGNFVPFTDTTEEGEALVKDRWRGRGIVHGDAPQRNQHGRREDAVVEGGVPKEMLRWRCRESHMGAISGSALFSVVPPMSCYTVTGAGIAGGCMVRARSSTSAEWVLGVKVAEDTLEVRIDGTDEVREFEEIVMYEARWWQVTESGRDAMKKARGNNGDAFRAWVAGHDAFEKKWKELLDSPDACEAAVREYVEKADVRQTARLIHRLHRLLGEAAEAAGLTYDEPTPDLSGVPPGELPARLEALQAKAREMAVQPGVPMCHRLRLAERETKATHEYLVPLGDATPPAPPAEQLGAAGSGTHHGSLVTVHIGGAGVNVGMNLWELYAEEHGLLSGDAGAEPSHVVFSEEQTGYSARCMFIDSDGSDLDRLRKSRFSPLLGAQCIVGSNQSCSDMYCRGYYQIGRQLASEMESNLYTMLERCDSVEGLQVVHGMGGAGSGISARFAEILDDSFPKLSTHNYAILSKQSHAPMQVYNTMLSLANRIRNDSLVTLIDNFQVYKVFDDVMHQRSVKYHHVNNWIAQAMSLATSTMRYIRGADDVHLSMRNARTQLAPYPQLSFTSASVVPCVGERDQGTEVSTEEIVISAQRRTSLASVPLVLQNSKYLSHVIYMRGNIRHEEAMRASLATATQRDVIFPDWRTCGAPRFAISRQPPMMLPGSGFARVPRAACYFAIHGDIATYVRGHQSAFGLMWARRAFASNAMADGMEEGELAEASDQVEKYLGIMKDTCTSVEEDEEDEEDYY